VEVPLVTSDRAISPRAVFLACLGLPYASVLQAASSSSHAEAPQSVCEAARHKRVVFYLHISRPRRELLRRRRRFVTLS